jgi:hypothetical protein
VHAEDVDGRVALEDLRGAVALVDVEVDDGGAPDGALVQQG